MLDRLWHQFSRKIQPPKLIKYSTALAVGALLGALSFMMVEIWEMKSGVVVSTDSTTNVADANAQKRLPSFSTLSIFGAHQANIQTIPTARIQYRLEGILRSADPNQSRVLISAAGKPGQTYHLGDSFGNGIVIRQILDDSVIFERNGQLEKLTLPRPELKFGTPLKSLSP